MQSKHNKQLVPLAKHLRKEMTKEERHLWYDFLKSQPVIFKRQKVIGNYIVDFFCAEAKLVIELDGSQHYNDAGKAADMVRDQYLKDKGLTVLRYSNLEIAENFAGVCTDIRNHIGRCT